MVKKAEDGKGRDESDTRQRSGKRPVDESAHETPSQPVRKGEPDATGAATADQTPCPVVGVGASAERLCRDEQDRPVRNSGVNHDITDRKETERALRESEEKYRQLFDSMTEGFLLIEVTHDHSGEPVSYRFLDANPALERLTHLKREQILGRDVRQVLPEIEPYWIQTFGQVARTGEPMHLEQYNKDLDNWFDVFAYCPSPGKAALIFTNTTERRRSEQALRQSREDLARAQAVGQIGSWRLDVGRNVLTWSDENHRIFGIPKGTPLTYETFLGTVHPDDRQYVDTRWQAALRGEPYDIEHRLMVDGHVKWVRERAYLEFDDDGTLRGGFGITQDITQRKKAQEQMASLAKFPSENPFPVLRIGHDGEIRYANGPASTVLAQWKRDVGDRAPDHWCEATAAALRSGRPNMEDMRVNGRVFSFAIAPVPEAGYANLYGTDITQRKEAELALREAHDRLEERVRERTAELEQTADALREEVIEKIEAQKALEHQNEILQKIIDNIPVMLCFYDADGSVALINEELRKVLGFSLEDFQENDVMELCYPDPVYRKHAWEYMMAAEPGWREFIVERKRGGQVASSWANVRLSDGSYVGIGIDVRQRKRYENRIRESEERYRTLVELSPDGIGVEREGTVRFVNTTACTLLGAERAEDLTGKPILDFVHPDHRRRAEKQLEYLRWRKKPLPAVEAKVMRLDGTALDVELSGMPIVLENEPAVQIVMRDITVRKQQEQAILQNQQQLAELTEELLLTEERERHRIATALHDSIGQSLAFSKRELGVLARDLPGALTAPLERARDELNEAIRQTRSLTFELSPATLYAFGLEAVVEELAEQFSQRETFQCHFESQGVDTPMSEQTKLLLYRATRELLVNATKHAAARNVTVRIKRDDQAVCVAVEDDGKGFDVSRLEPVHGRRQTFGLFSIRQRLAYTKGSFKIDSAPGEGTRVTMRAPLEMTEEHDSRRGPS